jgi:hypothetical protein
MPNVEPYNATKYFNIWFGYENNPVSDFVEQVSDFVEQDGIIKTFFGNWLDRVTMRAKIVPKIVAIAR